MMAADLEEQRSLDAAELARSLTVLQLGIDVLMGLSSAGYHDIDTASVIQSLTSATERVTHHITVLGMTVQLPSSPL
jgi:hypothetical protein